MERYINIDKVAAVQFTTPAENPLVTDDTRMIDAWFGGGNVIRKQMFKKVKKSEQELLEGNLAARGFVRTGNLLIDPKSVVFAEMEHELVGGLVTLGWQENGKPVELKVNGKAFRELCGKLEGK